MEIIKILIDKIEALLKWWVVVLPWEQGIRVRLGKRSKILSAGVYFRIPYIDACFVHSTRLHFINLPPQTISTADGKAVTVTVIVGYVLEDIEKMYNNIQSFEATICGIVQSSNTVYISNTPFIDCNVNGIEAHAIESLSRYDWGIKIEKVAVTSFFESRVYRLVSDSAWMPSDSIENTSR